MVFWNRGGHPFLGDIDIYVVVEIALPLNFVFNSSIKSIVRPRCNLSLVLNTNSGPTCPSPFLCSLL